jgi:hypothetical protein
MAPASLHQQLRGGLWNARALAEHARCLGRPLSMPAPSRAVLSPTAAPTTECRKPRWHRSTTRYRPRSFPLSRSNLQHRPDDPGRPLSALTLGRAPLAERSSRRYTRSPGEAGGGRGDLCHDNDEPDPVNRRGRIGDNSVDPTTELYASARGLLEFIPGWLPSRNEELPTDLQEWKPELGDNRERSKCSRGRHIKGLPGRPSAVVLEPGVYHFDVGEMEFGGGCRHPIHPTTLGIDQGEGCRSVGDGQREAGQSCA